MIRGQHIVSRFLLERFTAPDGLFWVYEKDRTPRQSNPVRECKENNYFEITFRGKKTNNSYENWLAEIEQSAAPLVSGIASRQTPTKLEAVVWATFVASIFGRTRKVRDQISNAMAKKMFQHTESDDYIRQMQLDLLKIGEFHYADDLRKSVKLMREAMSESPSFYHVTGLPHRMQIVREALLRRDWFTVETSASDFFLTSDSPVVTFQMRPDGGVNPGSGFGIDDTVVCMPVSTTHMFIASPKGSKWESVCSSKAVRTFNHLVVQFAHKNVYSHVKSDEIRTLVDAGINHFVYGENVFVPSARS